jgi:hypothetical protein
MELHKAKSCTEWNIKGYVLTVYLCTVCSKQFKQDNYRIVITVKRLEAIT